MSDGDDIVTASDVVRISHHQFGLIDDIWPGARTETSVVPGLATIHPPAVLIYTGVAGGVVNVSVEVREAPPAAPELDGWDEIADFDFETVTGEMMVAATMFSSPQLPVLTPDGPGRYRARLSVRGRDTSFDLTVTEPVEDYDLKVWPVNVAQATISHKQTDEYGARRRARGK